MQWRLNDDDLEDDDDNDDYSKTSLDKKADALDTILSTYTQCDIYTAISLIKTTTLDCIVAQTCLRQKISSL